MKKVSLLCLTLLLTSVVVGQTVSLKTADIHIRDPFVFADRATSTCYLYAQAANRPGSGYQGVEVYTSTNLTDWTPPRPVLALPDDQKVAMVWAPEMHAYDGAYYLFVTLTFRDTLAEAKPVDTQHGPPLFRRGTWIFRADRPDGLFRPLADASATPPAWPDRGPAIRRSTPATAGTA